MKKLFVMMLAGVTLFSSMTLSTKAAVSEIPKMSQQEITILKETNQLRQSKGLGLLTTFSTLQSAAKTRSDEQVSLISHTRPDGTQWSSVFAQYGIARGIGGENIAINWDTPENAMYGWKNSPGHYANLVAPNYCHLGVGYTHDENSLYKDYYVQLFISGCAFSSLDVVNLPDKYAKGSSIEDLNLWARVSCSHGYSYTPITSEMVSGYNANSGFPQTIVVSFNGIKKSVTLGATSTSKSKKVAAPSKIKTLSVKKQKSSIKLTWSTSKNATKYMVYKSIDDKSYKRIAFTSKKTFVDKKVKKGHVYRYKVRGYNAKAKNNAGVFCKVKKVSL